VFEAVNSSTHRYFPFKSDDREICLFLVRNQCAISLESLGGVLLVSTGRLTNINNLDTLFRSLSNSLTISLSAH